MLSITLAPNVREKLKNLLLEEDNDAAKMRIREVKAGSGCKSHIELRLSIDERDELEDEEEISVDGVPFVVHPDVIDTYGSVFSVSINEENGMPVVKTPNFEAGPACCKSK